MGPPKDKLSIHLLFAPPALVKAIFLDERLTSTILEKQEDIKKLLNSKVEQSVTTENELTDAFGNFIKQELQSRPQLAKLYENCFDFSPNYCAPELLSEGEPSMEGTRRPLVEVKVRRRTGPLLALGKKMS